ncbi:MAG: 2-oxoacid:acceptor oxidoreductase family protein [Thermovirgaceae bacterium]
MQYVIVGIGGQGILFSSRVLGHIAISKDETVIGSEVHGMAQRGGSVISHFKIGDYSSPLVKAGEADTLLAFDQNEAFRNFHFLREGGKAIVNVHDKEALENGNLRRYIEERSLEVHPIEGYEILKKHMGGKFLFLNILILGAMSGVKAGDVTLEEVRCAIKELAPPKFIDANMKVVDLGYEATR